MRKSIATVRLGGSLPEKLSAAAQAGFHGLEIFEQADHPALGGERSGDIGISLDDPSRAPGRRRHIPSVPGAAAVGTGRPREEKTQRARPRR
ncbi:hypothetical protein ACFPH6_26010 [Streptomyces xiangluensis]|uniref:Sugar phosphate isomerase/epimerase n=1 Tax=Streptomyces xiangluensis TaxID=2665720 RepID=A0ABV8YV04_9ACTN